MSTVEQLSTSGDTPKIKLALQEKYQAEKKELKERPKNFANEMDKLPLPVGFGSFEDSLISFFLVGFTPTRSLFGNSIVGF